MPHLGGPQSSAAAAAPRVLSIPTVQVVTRPRPRGFRLHYNVDNTETVTGETLRRTGLLPANSILVAARFSTNLDWFSASLLTSRIYYLNNPAPVLAELITANQLAPTPAPGSFAQGFFHEPANSAQWLPINLLTGASPGYVHVKIIHNSVNDFTWRVELIVDLPPIGA